MAWHLWCQASISHHPTLGGTEKMRSWPNLPYAVLDEHSLNVAEYHEVAKMLWISMTGPHQKDRSCCWCSICSSIQRAELRTGHAQTQQIFIQFWSYISTVYAQTRDACICPTSSAMDFQGTQVPSKWQGSAEAVTKTSNNAHVQRRLKPQFSFCRPPSGKQPTPHLRHLKKINQHSNSSQSNQGFGAHFQGSVSSSVGSQVTAWPAASAKCQSLPPGYQQTELVPNLTNETIDNCQPDPKLLIPGKLMHLSTCLLLW